MRNHGIAAAVSEQWARDFDAHLPYIATGGQPIVPSASMTLDPFATSGYVVEALGAESTLVYARQPATSLTLAGPDGTYWVALHASTIDAIAGWTRQPFTRYLYQQAASNPGDPSNGHIFAEVTVTAGAITAVKNIAYRSPISAHFGVQNVRDWGALGNESADDSAAIQAAIDALPFEGGDVIFPPGRYLCAGINVRSCVRLLGTGMPAAPGGNTILINNSTTGQHTIQRLEPTGQLAAFGINIERLRFQLAAGSTAGDHIRLDSAAQSQVSHCHIVAIGANQSGVHFDGSLVSGVQWCTIRDNEDNPGTKGIEITDNGFGASDNRLTWNIISQCVEGIRVEGPHNSIVENDIEAVNLSLMTHGITITGSTAWGNALVRNRHEMGNPGGTPTPGNVQITNGARYTVVQDGWFSSGENGIVIDGAHFTRVIRGVYQNHTSRPIWVKPGSEDTKIVDIINISGNLDVLNQGTRTTRDRHDSGAGAAFAGTGRRDIASAGVDVAPLAGGNSPIKGVQGISGTTLDAQNLRGTVTFATAGTVNVSFATAEPDANYFIVIGQDTNGETISWSGKSTTGFTLNSTNVSSTATVDWAILR